MVASIFAGHDSGVKYVDTFIAITDTALPNYAIIDSYWPLSNPRGYAEWFKEQMKAQFDARRKSLAEGLNASVEEVPEYKIKTPLQRAIQILKRHRDIRFAKDQENKPISIIITTLAAQAYENEFDLLDALNNIVDKMPNFILRRNGVVWIPNPVNPLENFADRWQEHPQREKNFISWLNKVRADLQLALQQKSIRDTGESLRSQFGDRPINEALQYFPQGTMKASGFVVPSTPLATRFNVAHREEPRWPVRCVYPVEVSGRVKRNGQWYGFNSDSRALPKRCDLMFSARTDAPRPFDVYWQIVNTGFEARNQLRGQIIRSKTAGVGGLTQIEATAYTGMHWVECFIVKNGVCVARSGEFVVNIE